MMHPTCPESCAILKCQNVSNNNKSTSYISVVDCDLLKGSKLFIKETLRWITEK